MTLGPNDHIMFRDGERDDSPLIAKYADCASGEIRLYSTDRYLLVNFVSDASEPGNGFKLDYQTVESSKATKWVLHIIVFVFFFKLKTYFWLLLLGIYTQVFLKF